MEGLVVVVFAGIALVYQSELMTIVTAPHRKAMLQIDSSRVSQTLSPVMPAVDGWGESTHLSQNALRDMFS